jgi:hypothetical protein
MRTIPPLLEQMLMTVRQNKPVPPYKPKSFGCIFYEMQMIMAILREQQALVAVKTVELKGKPQMLYLKPPAPGEEFRRADISATLKTELVVVFEGVVQNGLSLQELGDKIEEIGFTKLILTCASTAVPFEHGSTLEDVENFELDHIFCNSLQQEIKTCC